MAPEVQGHVSKRAVVGGSDDRAKPLKGEEWNVKLQDRTLGFVITYVDAMSVVSPEEMVASVPERIQAQWKRSPPEWVSEEKWVKFCGLEMKWQAGGLLVGQPSYAASLLETRPEVRGTQFPFPKVELVEELNITAEEVHAAQSVVGELLWLSVRTRPDLSFGVSWMGRMGYVVTEASGEVSGPHAGIRQGNPTSLPEVSEASRRPWSPTRAPTSQEDDPGGDPCGCQFCTMRR
jgi:hypothetical protein